MSRVTPMRGKASLNFFLCKNVQHGLMVKETFRFSISHRQASNLESRFRVTYTKKLAFLETKFETESGSFMNDKTLSKRFLKQSKLRLFKLFIAFSCLLEPIFMRKFQQQLP